MPEKDSDRQNLANRLKEMREYLSISQEEVAHALKIPRSAVSLIESGERKVDALELKRFAELYRCSVEHFTGPVSANDDEDRKIAFLAKAAAKLTKADRDELLRFAQFLKSKKGPGS
jgi:transcriptional regulator with XRE-family HTH domain